jgi:hypothetical protein
MMGESGAAITYRAAAFTFFTMKYQQYHRTSEEETSKLHEVSQSFLLPL